MENKGVFFRGLLIAVAVLWFQSLTAQDKAIYQDPRNHIYQYSVPVESRLAYLWIPANCTRVRGVIISMANLLERQWLEDPLIRETARSEGLGIIWIGPVANNNKGKTVLTADMRPGAGELLQKMLADFADESGYKELKYAPIISMGHSANGHFAWGVPNWDPNRTIAAIPVKTIPLPAKLNFRGVPLCYVVGETTEWPQFRVPDPATKPGDRDFYWPVVTTSAVALRKEGDGNLISVVVDPGGGHFDWSEHLAKFISLYIRKACKYRLPENAPKDAPVKLNSINPQSGWLTDTGGIKPDTHAPAAYDSYKGDPRKSYWFFDKQTAHAAADFDGDRRPREKQMLSYLQDGHLVPVAKLGFAALKYEPLDSVNSFQVSGAFLTELPPELIGAGTKLGHSEGAIGFKVITGPAVQIGQDKFRVQFNRADQGGAIWIQEEHPGNGEYRHAVQPGQIMIPAKLIKGEAQSIDFPAIGDQKLGLTTIELSAVSTSKLPVSYYIVSGPAIIVNNRLSIEQVPVNTRFPIKVTVVAYQYGSMVSPQYQSAEPVKQSFFINK